ncbi:MAG TPA: DUF2914 domain-containing protein [Thermodesulfovibrionales bacterium]|nr:DUF2914 domain-containing protein [Thermodesulfovibrionales bacterium]
MKNKTSWVIILAFVVIVSLGITSPAIGQEKAEKGAQLFSILTMVVAEDVQDRQPVGVAETFPVSTEKVYCFIEATNIEEDTEANFVWYHEGKEMRTFTLPLMEGPRWRTFAYKNLYGLTGNWKVEIKDKTGNSIKSITFKVE